MSYPWLETGRPDRITKTEEARRRFEDLSGIRRRKEDDFARVTHNAPVGGLHTAGLAASKWRLTTQPNYSRNLKRVLGGYTRNTVGYLALLVVHIQLR